MQLSGAQHLYYREMSNKLWLNSFTLLSDISIANKTSFQNGVDHYDSTNLLCICQLYPNLPLTVDHWLSRTWEISQAPEWVLATPTEILEVHEKLPTASMQGGIFSSNAHSYLRK